MSRVAEARINLLPSIDCAAIDIDDKVQALRTPHVHGHDTRVVEVIETHFAWVFLTERLVYKLKKPIRADRLTQTTLAHREYLCREELRLNRRLAASVYLDVMPLCCSPEQGLNLDGQGVVVEWLVKMLRLSRDAMLDRAMQAGHVDPRALASIARLLADFYVRQPPIEFTALDYLTRIREQMNSNHHELGASDLGLPSDVVDELHAVQSTALDTVSNELSLRATERRIVEGHGDLRPEHVYLGESPCVIDALEFSRDLRILDPVEELAFLCVECAHARHEDIGLSIVNEYCRLVRDAFSSVLFDFYRSHRAATRAKLVAWHLRDPAFESRAPWIEIAVAYVARAIDYATRVLRSGGRA